MKIYISRVWYEPTVTVQSLPVQWLSDLPFKDYLPSVNLTTWRALSLETTTGTTLSLPIVSPLSALPYQEYLPGITVPTKDLCLLGEPNNKHAESLPKYHQWISFQSLLLRKAIVSTQRGFLSKDLNNECAQSFPVSLIIGLFRTIFQMKAIASMQRAMSWKNLDNEHSEMSLPQGHWWMAFSRPYSK